jgi:hypothetical protein
LAAQALAEPGALPPDPRDIFLKKKHGVGAALPGRPCKDK